MVLLAPLNLVAQTVEAPNRYQLLHMHLDAPEGENPNFGPNQMWFIHGFSGFSYALGSTKGSGAQVDNLNARNMMLGIRFKRKINNILSFGWDWLYDKYKYRIQQNSMKTFPDTTSYAVQRLGLHSARQDVFFRINFDFGQRRGNVMGSYLDLGAYGALVFGKRSVVQTQDAANEDIKIIKNKLQYIETPVFGLTARLGLSRYLLFVNYRLTELVNQDLYNFDFQKITFGFQVGYHK